MTLPKKKKKVAKKKSLIVPFEIIGDELNACQEAFCNYYTGNDILFGNATLCYAEAYRYNLDMLDHDDAKFVLVDKKTGKQEKIEDSSYDKAYNVCSVSGFRLLRNPKIQTRINKILNEMMRDDIVDTEIMHTIRQRTDYSAKMSAIKEYNKIKDRITSKTDITSGGEKLNLVLISDEEKERIKSLVNRE